MSTITEPPSTHPLVHITDTIETICTSTSTDPQLEPLSIPTFSQIQSQPQTIESTSNETSLDNLYQDIDTVTRGFNPHAGPALIEPASEHPPQEVMTSNLPIVSQLPTIPHDPTYPPNWDTYSRSQKRHWRQRNRPK